MSDERRQLAFIKECNVDISEIFHPAFNSKINRLLWFKRQNILTILPSGLSYD